jgi:predicted Zn-dependent protease
MRGDIAEALPILKANVQREPAHPVYQYHLGMAYMKAGERAGARAALEAAIARGVPFEGLSNAKTALESLR